MTGRLPTMVRWDMPLEAARSSRVGGGRRIYESVPPGGVSQLGCELPAKVSAGASPRSPLRSPPVPRLRCSGDLRTLPCSGGHRSPISSKVPNGLAMTSLPANRSDTAKV